MNWTESYSASWQVYKVDRKTWADAERADGIDSISITRTADGSLIESGTIEITGDLPTDYYRIVMTAEQDGNIERVDVATLLFDITGGEYNYNFDVQTANGYSVLYPASVMTVLEGEYAPKGINGVEYAGELLQTATNAPIEIEGASTLNDHVVFKVGSSVLEAVWTVLDACNFVVQIDGRGVVHILPKPTVPELIITNSNARMLSDGVKHTTDISEIPNRYVVIDDLSRTIATNNDETSEVSVVNRGHYVDEVDESPTPANGETMSAYANRRLEEMSVMTDEREYTREYAPGVHPYSVVKASINGLSGNLRVVSQDIDCNYGITVTEKVTKEVVLWSSKNS